MSAGARAGAAAGAAVGVRFRLHGRDRSGLDCVGVAALALAAGGVRVAVPSGYALRHGCAEGVAGVLDPVLARGSGGAVGDLLLLRPGAGQLHLGVKVAEGLVHADAGLGRVVMRPGVLPWPLVAAWTWGEGG